MLNLFSSSGTSFQSFDDKKVKKTTHFPEAMVCKYKAPNSPNYEEAGILLISAPDSLINRGSTWTVGIDFGTSSTTVYRKDPQNQQEEPQRVVFDSHLFQVTNSDNLRVRLYDDFLSPRSERTPFFSLFHNFLDSENKKKLKPLRDGHIYFLNDYRFLDNDRTFGSAGNIVTDLKWSAEPRDRIRARAFLEQLCLQCTAEAVTKGARTINWRFSYPIAFSDDDRGQFQNIWRSITNACVQATGLLRGEVNSEPESVVAAKFFASTRQSPTATGAFASGAVCIDIGGETSDISIWQDHELYWQTSLKFAGRHLFLDLLRANPEFLENFGFDSEDIKLLKLLKDESTPGDFYAQADAWIDASINNSGQDLENVLQDKFGIYGGNADVKTFVQLIAMGVSGLLYYVGLVLNYLAKNKGLERRMPSIYIGGNGSRILDWIARGKFGVEEASKRPPQRGHP